MPPEPVPADPGPDEDLAWLDRDPMTAGEREAALDRICEEGEPPELDDYGDYEPLTPAELAGIRLAAADELLAVEAAAAGRRGPGQPGSARIFPGESSSPAAGFGPGMVLDVLPGGPGLAAAAGAAVDDGFAGMSEGELIGIMCAWDRVEAHAAARKLAVVAELGRRAPRPEDAEFTADEIACALGESRSRAYDLMDTAGHLDTRLPGTWAALCDGTLSLYKARLIAAATALLDRDEARAAENKVLDRAAVLTPGGLRAAIARAVVEAAPEKARQRRETAAKFARVERWAEDSGNAALARHADRPAGHRGRAFGPARRAVRAGPGRPVAGPRPAPRRRAEPQDHVVRDRDRPARPRHRPRLRPARTREPRQTRRARTAAGPDGILLHPGQPGRPARRIRHLAAAHPRTRAGPDRRDRPADHPGLRAPVPSPGP